MCTITLAMTFLFSKLTIKHTDWALLDRLISSYYYTTLWVVQYIYLKSKAKSHAELVSHAEDGLI